MKPPKLHYLVKAYGSKIYPICNSLKRFANAVEAGDKGYLMTIWSYKVTCRQCIRIGKIKP